MSSEFSSNPRLGRNKGVKFVPPRVTGTPRSSVQILVGILVFSSFQAGTGSSTSKFCTVSESISRMSHAFETMRSDFDWSPNSTIEVFDALLSSVRKADSALDLSSALALTSSLMHQWRSITTATPESDRSSRIGRSPLFEDELRALWLGIQHPSMDFWTSVEYFVAKAGMIVNAEPGSSRKRSTAEGPSPESGATLKTKIQSLPLAVFEKDSLLQVNSDYNHLHHWLSESGWFSEVEPEDGIDENIIVFARDCREGARCSTAKIVLLNRNTEANDGINPRKSDILRRYLNIPDISFLTVN